MIKIINNGKPYTPSHAATKLLLVLLNDRVYRPQLTDQDGIDTVLRDALRVINRCGYIGNEQISLDDLDDGAAVRWVEAQLLERL